MYSYRSKPAHTVNGFTFFELFVVIAIISILAAVAIPAYNDYIIRASVAEGLVLAEPLKKNITDYYAWHGRLPADNKAAGVLPADKIQGSYVAAVRIEQGSIHIEYGNRSEEATQGNIVSLIPTLPEVSPVFLVALTWRCTSQNNSINSAFLPTACQ